MLRVSEILLEGYRLSDGSEVLYQGSGWVDHAGNEYSPVHIGNTDSKAALEPVGFVRRATLSADAIELLRRDPEGAAYVEYERRVGGERILPLPTGYPSRVQAYLDKCGSLEGLYHKLIDLGVTWYEYFSIYPVEHSESGYPEYEEVRW